MSSCITKQWVTNAPQLRLDVVESASSGSTSTLSWSLYYIASYAVSSSTSKSYSVVIDGATVKSGTFSIGGKTGTNTIASGTVTINKTKAIQKISFSCSMAFNITFGGVYGGTKSASGSISVDAITSYKVSYNANGGTGAPGSQTKTHGTNLTISSIKPSRTGYTFLGWSTSSSSNTVSYSPGGTYTNNSSVTLYAVWKANTYTVSYNANGGTGAPVSQTKTHGQSLTLSSVKPTRTNYIFVGWGISPSSTTVSYSPGGTYANNSSVTLYAIWEIGYIPPRIDYLSVDRCDSEGDLVENGSYARVVFEWISDEDVSEIKIEWKSSDSTTYSNNAIVPSTGTYGSVDVVVGSGLLQEDVLYNFVITVTDSNGTNNNTKDLSPISFIIDLLAGGKGIAFGKPATRPGVDFGMDAYDKYGNEIIGITFEEGSNENGYYRKWSNGILECWIDKTNVVWPIGTAYGSLFHGTYSWTYPYPFVSTPNVVNLIRAWWGSGASWGSVYSFSKSQANFRAYDITSRSEDASMKFSAYAKGRWK